jgi:hypothetical protein
LNTNPPTDQKLFTPELSNIQAGLKDAAVPVATYAAKLPLSLKTVGVPGPVALVHAMTLLAVPASLVSNVTPPVNTILPEIGSALAPASVTTVNATARTLFLILVFIL